jgi:hypothetical protein
VNPAIYGIICPFSGDDQGQPLRTLCRPTFLTIVWSFQRYGGSQASGERKIYSSILKSQRNEHDHLLIHRGIPYRPALQAFFEYLDILVFVEATIYQADEANELYAKQGLLLPQAHSDCAPSSSWPLGSSLFILRTAFCKEATCQPV